MLYFLHSHSQNDYGQAIVKALAYYSLSSLWPFIWEAFPVNSTHAFILLLCMAFICAHRHSRLNKINRKKKYRISGMLRIWSQHEFLQWEVIVEQAGRMVCNQFSSEKFKNDAMAIWVPRISKILILFKVPSTLI